LDPLAHIQIQKKLDLVETLRSYSISPFLKSWGPTIACHDQLADCCCCRQISNLTSIVFDLLEEERHAIEEGRRRRSSRRRRRRRRWKSRECGMMDKRVKKLQQCCVDSKRRKGWLEEYTAPCLASSHLHSFAPCFIHHTVNMHQVQNSHIFPKLLSHASDFLLCVDC
jgi:hypothetical protein